MRIFGYARVSTNQESRDIQIEALQLRYPVENWVSQKVGVARNLAHCTILLAVRSSQSG